MILSKKENDCFVCAYASCEGVSWSISKRRLRKRVSFSINQGVNSEALLTRGLPGYVVEPIKRFYTLNEAFRYKTGILTVSFGNGLGHAVYWDGIKMIDSKKDSRFHQKRDLSMLNGKESLNMIIVKNSCSPILRLCSIISHFFQRII